MKRGGGNVVAFAAVHASGSRCSRAPPSPCPCCWTTAPHIAPLAVTPDAQKLRLRFSSQGGDLDRDQGRRWYPSRTSCQPGYRVTNQLKLRPNVQFCPGKLHLGPKRSLSGFGGLACSSFATDSWPRPKSLLRVPWAISDRATPCSARCNRQLPFLGSSTGARAENGLARSGWAIQNREVVFSMPSATVTYRLL
jgi:hypothetical protein